MTSNKESQLIWEAYTPSGNLFDRAMSDPTRFMLTQIIRPPLDWEFPGTAPKEVYLEDLVGDIDETFYEYDDEYGQLLDRFESKAPQNVKYVDYS